MLFVDEFDPHEPFDTPEPYASMYDPDWEGPHIIWPPYVAGGIEKGIWGKPGVPVYEPLGHIPLMIAHPGIAPGTCDALTTGVDLFATLAELFGVDVRQRTHGRSLLPLLRGETGTVRDWLLTGVWGREVHYIDGRYKYARGPAGDNAPLSMMSNRCPPCRRIS